MKNPLLCIYSIGVSFLSFSQSPDSLAIRNPKPVPKWTQWPSFQLEIGLATNYGNTYLNYGSIVAESRSTKIKNSGNLLDIAFNINQRLSLGLNYFKATEEVRNDKWVASYEYFSLFDGVKTKQVWDKMKILTKLRYFNVLLGYNLLQVKTNTITVRAGLSIVSVVENAEIKGYLVYPDPEPGFYPPPTIITNNGFYKQSGEGVNFMASLEYSLRLFRKWCLTIHVNGGLGVIQPKMSGEVLEVSSSTEIKYYGIKPHDVRTFYIWLGIWTKVSIGQINRETISKTGQLKFFGFGDVEYSFCPSIQELDRARRTRQKHVRKL